MTSHIAFLLVALIPTEEAPSLGDWIVAYASSKLGERVGDGRCTDLVTQALKAAGATLPTRGSGAAWGEPVGSVAEIRPGTILDFRDATFVRRRVSPNGAVKTTTMTMGHHVAIVEAVRKGPGATRLAILHQNAGPEGQESQVVQRWVIDPADLRGGTVRAYRPVPADSQSPCPPPSEPR